MVDLSFYNNKIVLVTGHTGFKGTWLCKILLQAGAKVIGYSIDKPTQQALYDFSKIDRQIISIMGDIRDYEHLQKVFDTYHPELVFHLAAQPIVRESYVNPKYTYETNVLGTVNVLECVRKSTSVKSVLNVTTDKVYENKDEYNHPFSEEEPLDGYDPYSNSKSCSELVTHSYKKSFLDDMGIAVSTARAGNVIGGGDFAKDRIIPDCVRAIEANEEIKIRNPKSTRPYQHVLEPLFVYLEIVEKQYNDKSFAGYYNVGPDDCDCVNTGELVDMFCKNWGDSLSYIVIANIGPHEAGFLKLDNSKIKRVFKWSPRWHINEAISKIIEWTKVYLKDKEMIPEEMDREIQEYLR